MTVFKSITVGVDEDFYDYLVEIQEERKETEGRKPALADILLGLAKEGKELSTQNFGQNSVLNDVQNSAYSLDAKYLEVREQNLLKRLSNLDEWERNLMEKESEIRESQQQIDRQEIQNHYDEFEFDRLRNENDEFKKEISVLRQKLESAKDKFAIAHQNMVEQQLKGNLQTEKSFAEYADKLEDILDEIGELKKFQPKDLIAMSVPLLPKIIEEIEKLAQHKQPLKKGKFSLDNLGQS